RRKPAQLPTLLTIENSNRAVALELTQFVLEPFSLTTTLLTDGHNRTRIMVFGTNLGLQPGEGVESITAEGEDDNHVRYPLRVEYVGPLAEVPNISQIVIRLTREFDDVPDPLISITVHGWTSNKVSIRIQP